MRISLPSILWLVVGALVASAHHYLENLDAIRPVVSAVLAVVLWPLLLLGRLELVSGDAGCALLRLALTGALGDQR
jgi:hypothetical protein